MARSISQIWTHGGGTWHENRPRPARPSCMTARRPWRVGCCACVGLGFWRPRRSCHQWQRAQHSVYSALESSFTTDGKRSASLLHNVAARADTARSARIAAGAFGLLPGGSQISSYGSRGVRSPAELIHVHGVCTLFTPPLSAGLCCGWSMALCMVQYRL